MSFCLSVFVSSRPNIEMSICKAVSEYLLTDNYHNNHHLLSLNYPAETMLGISHLFHFSPHINPKRVLQTRKEKLKKVTRVR